MRVLLRCSIITLTGLLIISCSTPTITRHALRHMIAIEGDGDPFEFKSYEFPTNTFNDFEDGEYSFSNHIAEIIQGIKESGKTNILIFVHGGMNPLPEAMQRAATQSMIIDTSTDYYPIFVNWNSSMWSSYFENLFLLQNGMRSYVMRPLLSPFILMSDMGSAILCLPQTFTQQFYGWKKSAIMNPEYDEQQDITFIKPEHRIVLQHGDDYSGMTEFLAGRAVYGLMFPFRMMTTPLLDAFGNRAWSTMNRRTRTVFRRPETLGDIKSENPPRDFHPPDGGLGILMTALSELHAKDPRYKFTIIGHSMGTIILNELLFDYDNLPYDNIVYMAAACSIRDMENAVFPYLQEHKNSRFYHLTLHQLADETENSLGSLGPPDSIWQWMQIVPRGSLLEWVDAYLSDAITPDDRTAGKWSNIVSGLPVIPPDIRSQISIKGFGIYDPSTNTRTLDKPQRHGDFTDANQKYWLHDYWRVATMLSEDK